MESDADSAPSDGAPLECLAMSFQRTCGTVRRPTPPCDNLYKSISLEANQPVPQHVMNILSYNIGHDGAIAYLQDGHLLVSIEAEKNSNYRHSPISSRDVFNALGELDEIPDVICTGGWWPRDHYEYLHGSRVQYRGVSKSDIIIDRRRLLGRPVHISRLLTSDRTYFALSACRACQKAPHAMRWCGKGR